MVTRLHLALGGVALAALFVLAGCSTTPAPTMTPGQVMHDDLQRAGMPNAPTAAELTASTSLICRMFRSGAPMESDDQGISTSAYVAALNDSHLCGPAPVALPPTAWPVSN